MLSLSDWVFVLDRLHGTVGGVVLLGTHGMFLKIVGLTTQRWRKKKRVGSWGRERQVCRDTRRRGKTGYSLRRYVMKFASLMQRNGQGWRYYSSNIPFFHCYCAKIWLLLFHCHVAIVNVHNMGEFVLKLKKLVMYKNLCELLSLAIQLSN